MTTSSGGTARRVSPSCPLAAKHQMTALHAHSSRQAFPLSWLCCCSFIHSQHQMQKDAHAPLGFLAGCPVGSVPLLQSCFCLISCPRVITPSTLRKHSHLPLDPRFFPPSQQEPSHTLLILNMFCSCFGSSALLPLQHRPVKLQSDWPWVVCAIPLIFAWIVPPFFPLFSICRCLGSPWNDREVEAVSILK